jgi:NAD(P)-dependent dehydrogenase (short-subunit alcohol dehydrogenase family)
MRAFLDTVSCAALLTKQITGQAGKHMIASGKGGSIINIASMSGHIGTHLTMSNQNALSDSEPGTISQLSPTSMRLQCM